MRKLLAYFFRFLFGFRLFEKHYYGFQKHVFTRLNLFKNVVVQAKTQDGVCLALHLDEWIQQHLFFLRNYESAELRFVAQTLKQGGNFVDVGANIGLFTLSASKAMHKHGKIWAFEPFGTNYDRLQTNIGLNACSNIQSFKIALSAHSGKMQLKYDEHEKNQGMVSAHSSNFTICEEVEMLRFDDFMVAHQIETVRLLKIDVEGEEYNVLKGMENLLSSQSPVLLVEINEQTPYPRNDIFVYLQTLGYVSYQIQADGSLVAAQSSSENYNFVFVK